MKINNIQNFQFYQQTFGEKQVPMHSTGSTAIAGQFGLLGAKQAFGTFNPEKINKSEKTTQLYGINSTRPKFLEMLGGVNSVHAETISGVNTISKNTKNPYLSNFRGEFGQNIPLGANAIHENGGRVGAKLNLIA